ncbi:WD40 repeat domain-containing protein [Streptomyces herbicida]|uniref:WD40 repeat domain-containing protein n=1 Tax=Streptomyces herbicida TaxID=3065675 RepID=UPI0029317AE1|nr:WD40 repeat domain-containing protein [Streptomyces sp. NEAU-HV9]
MSEIGEVLATAHLSSWPSEILWSADGQRLTVVGFGSSDESIRTLNTSTGETLWTLDVTDVRSLAVSADGQSLAFAGRLGHRRTIREWVEPIDCSELPFPKRAACEKWNREHSGWHVTGVEVPPDRIGVLAADSSTVRWVRDDAASATKHLSYSPDGTRLAAAGQSILLLDAANGELTHEVASFSPALMPPVFSKDSRWLVTADEERLVLIDVTSSTTRWVTSLPEPLAQFTFVEADSSIVAATERHTYLLATDDGGIRASADLKDPLIGLPTVLSADGRLLVRCGPDAMVLWEVADGSRGFETPVGNDAQARFNPALPEVAIASGSGMKIVNSRLGTTVWQESTDRLKNLAFARDGRRVALSGETGPDGQVTAFLQIRDMNPTGVSHRVFDGPVTRVALTSSPGPLAAAASQDAESKATVFHADTGELVLERIHPGLITALEFSPDGSHFATGSTEGGARLFDSSTGDRQWLVAHNAPVNALAFLPPGGHNVVTASGDKSARLITGDSGQERWRLTHPQGVTLVAASPDGRWIATACADRSTRIVNPGTGAELFRFRHDAKIRAIAFSPHGSMLAAGGDDGTVLIIDPLTGHVLGRSVHTREVTAVAFSHDETLLATAGKDQAVHLFNVGSTPPALARGMNFPQTITGLAFHPAVEQLALVSDLPSPKVTIMDCADGTELSRLNHPAAIHDLAYSPDGKLLATACEDTLVRVYPGRREA